MSTSVSDTISVALALIALILLAVTVAVVAMDLISLEQDVWIETSVLVTMSARRIQFAIIVKAVLLVIVPPVSKESFAQLISMNVIRIRRSVISMPIVQTQKEATSAVATRTTMAMEHFVFQASVLISTALKTKSASPQQRLTANAKTVSTWTFHSHV